VWVLSSGVYLDGEKVPYGHSDAVDPDQISRYERALKAGELELHGNAIWRCDTHR